MQNHERFYSFAKAYDLAFDFKDIGAECQFLRTVFETYTGQKLRSFLDLAAGPGLHAIEMANQGIEVAALDLAPEMVEYGLLKAENCGVKVDYRQGDMVNFTWSRKFDVAGIFMDSLCYLTDNESVISHLRSVAQILEPHGLYVLEMSHPRDVFSVGKSTVNSWEVEKDGLWTSVSWGDKADPFDPISQISQTTVNLKFRANGIERELIETAPSRCFTSNEFKALVLAEGSFEIAAMYGAMKTDVPFSNEQVAWRMIPVLKKRSSTHEPDDGK